APAPGEIEFPHYAAGLLESLNRHRLEGKFCDLSVHVQGRVFQAHKSVLAAASPYFHDKLLLRDAGRLVLGFSHPPPRLPPPKAPRGLGIARMGMPLCGLLQRSRGRISSAGQALLAGGVELSPPGAST
uniref:BTB domain-containing protein n=1 Tax=Pseudonaja textilis TaxID=8673 RepID=A0A670ZPG0_PSETE